MPSNRTCPVILALVNVGDRDRAPDGVLHTLTHEERIDLDVGDGSLDAVDPAQPPTIEEVVRFEDLPPGSLGSRRAVVRWSDGTQSETFSWHADEILICEGDLVGKCREQLRSLHFHRDRDWLQS
jgi:hypothetical protein